MSNNAKNSPAVEQLLSEAEKLQTVPEQSTPAESKVIRQLEEVQEAAVDDLQDALHAVESKMKHVYGVGVDVRITRNDEGEFTVEVVDPSESKLQRLKAGAKGVFQRNKKLVLTGAALLAASVALKVIAARQESDEEMGDGEIVEPADA